MWKNSSSKELPNRLSLRLFLAWGYTVVTGERHTVCRIVYFVTGAYAAYFQLYEEIFSGKRTSLRSCFLRRDRSKKTSPNYIIYICNIGRFWNNMIGFVNYSAVAGTPFRNPSERNAPGHTYTVGVGSLCPITTNLHKAWIGNHLWQKLTGKEGVRQEKPSSTSPSPYVPEL